MVALAEVPALFESIKPPLVECSAETITIHVQVVLATSDKADDVYWSRLGTYLLRYVQFRAYLRCPVEADWWPEVSTSWAAKIPDTWRLGPDPTDRAGLIQYVTPVAIVSVWSAVWSQLVVLYIHVASELPTVGRVVSFVPRG